MGRSEKRRASSESERKIRCKIRKKKGIDEQGQFLFIFSKSSSEMTVNPCLLNKAVVTP
ncbi:hypothetical protein protein [Bacillus cereus G9241]|nr:hypothetical protein protein [Bacillus cereus G9241]